MTGLKGFLREIGLLYRSVPSLIVSMFFISVIGMNLLANKSIYTGLDWLALDAGLIFSWLSFFTMDIIVKRFGLKAANVISISALLVNLFICLLFLLISYIPGEWSNSYVEGSEKIINEATDSMFRGSWYVVLGSSVAFFISALINNFTAHLLHRAFKNKTTFKVYAIASYISTGIGQFVDNLVFAIIVSKIFFGWTWVQCVTCATTGMLLELLFEVCLSPLGFLYVKRMERLGVGSEYIELQNARRAAK